MKKSKYRGHKAEDLLIINIARGIACYMHYYDIKGSSTISYEALLRLPVSEIAGAKGWSYLCEYKLKNDPDHKEGAFKKVDFVLNYYDQVIGIELKHLKWKGQGTQSLDLGYDIKKLKDIFMKDAGIEIFSKKYAFLIIFAEESVFNNTQLKGIQITRTLTESDILDKKRNILCENEAFKTQVTVGKKGLIVVAIKIKCS